jgi:PAS domain S-box-containing protein
MAISQDLSGAASASAARNLAFLAGGGDTGALIRDHPWEVTPLGPADQWPQPLKTLVGIMLGSNQPMFVAWGEERTFLYNDLYAQILAGKHPAIGRDFLEVWHEIRDDLVPIVDQAYRGEPVQMDDIELVMHRHGYPEETHFSFFYSPVRGEDGRVRGLFCACSEITGQVLAERRAAAERERQRLMLQQMPGFVAFLSGPEHRFDYVNDAYVELVGERDFIGRTVHDVFPEIADQGFFDLLDNVYRNDEAFTGRAVSVLLANRDEPRFVDLLYYPIRGDDGQTMGIFAGGYDVTDRVRGEGELRESEERFRAVLETSIDGMIVLGSVRSEEGSIEDFRVLYANAAAASVVGRESEDLAGKLLLQENPGNREAGLFDAYCRVVETGEPWSGEVRYRYEGLDIYVRVAAAKVADGLAVSFADVSEARRAEERMREAAERVQLALDAGAIIGTWVWDVPADRFTADERFAESFGLDPGRCRAGIPIEDPVAAIHEDDRPMVSAAIEEALGSGGSYRCQYRVRRPGGDYRWIEANGRVELGEDGTPLRFPGVLLDIEQRRTIEAERDQAMALLRSFTAAVPGVVYAKDREGRMLVANRGTAELLGKEPDDFIGRTDLEILEDKEQARAVMANDRRIMESGRMEQIEEEVRLSDGTPAVWLSTKAPLTDDDGKVIGLIGSSIDITARKRAEAALAESEARRRAALAAASLGTFDWNLGTEEVELDERSREIFGFGPDEGVLARQIFDRIHPEDYPAAHAAAMESAERLTQLVIEYRIVLPDGSARTVASLSDAVAGADGKAERMVGVFDDITERKRAETALHELNETLEAQVAERTAELDRTWRLSKDIFAIWNLDGVLQRANPAWSLILGFRPDEVEGRHHTELKHPNDRGRGDEALARQADGAMIAGFEDRYRHKDGSWRWISWSASAPESDLVYAVGRDITAEKERQAELEKAQEALRQVQKLEAMGTLTGGVAHDFNNLLTPIIGSLDMLQRARLEDPRLRRFVDGALKSAERAKTLIQRLLAFARRQPLQPTAVDLGALVEGMADLIASTSGPRVRVTPDVAPDLPPVRGDQNQLEMAILNLSVNARDAMPEGGALTISARRAPAKATEAQKLPPGDYVLLSVADTGTGMDEETLARAIEPFFSTKGIGRGTGLGLSMVHGLALQLGGALSIRSRPGAGTCVELWLPVATGEAKPAEAPTEEPVLAGAGKALLVEDEELVRASTADMLTQLGYEVVEASSAEQALKLVREGLAPDLMVTDHLMPGMTGAELARALKALRPGIRVLIVSGYAEDGGIDADLPRLTKPFRQAELAAALADLS